MSYRDKIKSLPNEPGIYVFYGFDGTPLYVGTTKRLRTRLKEHFIQFNSSIIADRTLEPREVAMIRYWLVNDSNEAKRLEKPFISKYQPMYNLSETDLKAKDVGFSIDLPSESQALELRLDLPQGKRGDPLVRLRHKSHLIYEMVLRFELTDLTAKDKRALVQHCKELLKIAENLN